MQEPRAQERTEYATLGHRAAAVIVDTLIVLVVSSIALAIAAAAGWIDLGFAHAATLNDILRASRTAPGWLMPLEYGLIFVYFTLFELRGATPGKRLFRLSVAGDDGARPRALAVVVRNLVRIPEMYFLYIPSSVSVLVSRTNKRLGDYAGKTIVLRHDVAPRAGGAQLTPPPAGTAAFATAAPPPEPSLDDALAALKTAALAVRGAHHNYLRLSEIELAKAETPAAGADLPAGAEEHAYSPEYVAAWHTLTGAVLVMQRALAQAALAAARAGTTLRDLGDLEPDLAYLFRELEPYFEAGSDEEVHAAYLKVARGDSSS